MEYIYEYLVFLAQAVTVVVALLVIISALASLGIKHQHEDQGGALQVVKLNDRVKEMRHVMEASVLPPGLVKKQHKAEAKADSKATKAQEQALKNAAKSEPIRAQEATPTASGERQAGGQDAEEQDIEEETSGVDTPVAHPAEKKPERIFFLHFEGDPRASAVERLRREINAVLTLATSGDEVVVSVESPGGMVPNYGLAASQLARFRDHDIPLTVVVDKVAASGGYLMAVVANRIVSAPFALVGSIGVVAQIPNVHRLLKRNDVDVEILTAGKYKRTLTVLGENTQEGRDKFLEELEDVHALFQEFVADFRPGLELERVATGEAWFGKRALELNLVDQLATSDEILLAACNHSDVFLVTWQDHKKPIERLLGRVNGVLERAEEVLARFAAR